MVTPKAGAAAGPTTPVVMNPGPSMLMVDTVPPSC